MSLSFCVLGSGSRGNCTLLAIGQGAAQRLALIDCGLSRRAATMRLAPLGVGLEDINDIIVTHFDTDHFQGVWVRHIQRHRVRVHVHERHRAQALRAGLDGACLELFRQPRALGDEGWIEPVLLAHDSVGTMGFVLEHDGLRLGFATDLGLVPDGLYEQFVNLHALLIESNYDRQMELSSDRPAFLKRRIMGGRGHLSNEQSLEAVLKIDGQSRLSHVVALHLSQQCNDPRLVKRLYTEAAPHLLEKLTISHQTRPTPLLHVRRPAAGPPPARHGQQLAMF